MQSARPSISGFSFPLDLSLISFLIVDDQPFSRRIVRSILLGFGSREVYESANGAEGIELARTVMPSIIITDIVMPASNGLRFISMVKAPESPAKKTPIIVLSGYLTRSAALAITESGVDEILVKPVAPKALYEHISRIVLRKDQADAPTAFLQNQRRRAELNRKKPSDVTLL
jgi:two-component system, chemotaxis family, chemotaxis protein CheY